MINSIEWFLLLDWSTLRYVAVGWRFEKTQPYCFSTLSIRWWCLLSPHSLSLAGLATYFDQWNIARATGLRSRAGSFHLHLSPLWGLLLPCWGDRIGDWVMRDRMERRARPDRAPRSPTHDWGHPKPSSLSRVSYQMTTAAWVGPPKTGKLPSQNEICEQIATASASKLGEVD